MQRQRSDDSDMAAALHFGGYHADAIRFVKGSGLMPQLMSESRFSRRLHRLADLTVQLFFQLGHIIKPLDTDLTYWIDSFLIKSCHNIRIRRSRLFKSEAFRRRNASIREYFYGVKVFVTTNAQNIQVEYTITPGSWGEIQRLRQMPLDLPPKACLFGDSGFTDYLHEEDLQDAEQIDLKVARRKNSKRHTNLGGIIAFKPTENPSSLPSVS